MSKPDLADDRPATPPLVVPYTAISADALHRVVEAFVLREGTEYGSRDFTLSEKVEQVLRQLARGEAEIIFDSETETVDIVGAPRHR